MDWFNNLKVGTKLLFSFMLVAVVAGIIGYEGISSLKNADESDKILYEKNAVPLAQMGDIGDAFQRQRCNLLELVLAKNENSRLDQVTRIKAREKEIEKNIDDVEKTLLTEVGRRILGTLKQDWLNFKVGRDRVMELATAGKSDEAVAFFHGDMEKTRLSFQTSLDTLQAMKIRLAKERSEINNAEANSAVNTMYILMIAGILIAIGLGIFISRIIGRPIKTLSDIAERLALGDTEAEIKQTSNDEIGILMGLFGKMVQSIKDQVYVADQIAAGNLNLNISVRSDKDVLGKSFIKVIQTLKDLVDETGRLSKAAVDGKLATRGNADKFQGGYKEIVTGVNSTLDAVIGPLNVAAEYVDRIAKGDIPDKITDNYNGDFNEIKNNLNICIDAIGILVEEVGRLINASKDGKLSTRAEYSRGNGVYRKLLVGLNDTLDAVINPLNVSADYIGRIGQGNIPPKITEKYNGDFNNIKDSINSCIDGLNGLVEANNVLNSLANKDFTTKVDGNYSGIFNEVKSHLNHTIEEISTVLEQVAVTSDQIVSGTGQVADASQTLSQGAAESASSLEEIASSMNEVSSQTKINAENANQSNLLASQSKLASEKGDEEMLSLMKAMSEIGESSKSISKIIKVIDEIAFQTNLLALNAAVEAARAGRHGKGFAVVAEEVRNLAARSAKAAKETAEMIESAVKKSENGAEIASRTAQALNEIKTGSTKVADIVGEIAAASNEQAQGIAQVNIGLNQIDKVTQQNTASAEETAAAAEELASQAMNLKELVEQFRLKRTGFQVSYESTDRVQTHRKTRGPQDQKRGMKLLSPKDVIKLDDEEFGKY